MVAVSSEVAAKPKPGFSHAKPIHRDQVTIGRSRKRVGTVGFTDKSRSDFPGLAPSLEPTGSLNLTL